MSPGSRRALLGLAVALCWRCVPAPAAMPVLTPPGPADRVLIVAPHPDDESLCCAGLIERARENGAAVAIVWLTAGDAFTADALWVHHRLWPSTALMRAFAHERTQEALNAAAALGVPRQNLFMLGYPDGGLAALLAQNYERTYTSATTGLDRVALSEALSPAALYQGRNLEHDLTLVLEQFRPTWVFAAMEQDEHPDHRASAQLVRTLLQRRGQLASLHRWIVHAPNWPRPYGLHPGLAAEPPAFTVGLGWQALALSADETTRKLMALDAHRSQMALTGLFMRSFVRASELFAPP